MKASSHSGTDHRRHRANFLSQRPLVAAVFAFSFVAGSVAVHAQATVANIFGWAPSGQTITVHSTSGVHRHAKANSKGRYKIGSLPMGVYTVALEKDGKAVDTRSNITLTVGRGAEVDFACPQDYCAEPATE